MKTVKLPQGSPEWHAHRAMYRNASEAPAAMNHSPYVKRNELIHMIKTGDKKAFSEYVQRYILDKGHRFEALARPIAEDIIGDDLAPLVGVEGAYSASFDGLTFFHDTGFEHKVLNNAIREAFSTDDLPDYYKEQMEHQAMVSGCEKILFLATRWEPCSEDDNEEGAIYGEAENEQGVMTRYKLAEKKHFWYYPDLELRAAVVAAWEQLERDVDAYEPEVIEPEHVAAEISDLPAVVVTEKTFPDKPTRESYTKLAKAMLAPTAHIPVNRQEAGDLLMRVEKVADNEKTFMNLSKQTDVSEAEKDAFRKWLDDMQKLFAKGRIDGGKNLESFKQNEKTEMVKTANDALASYIAGLNDALPKPFMPDIPVDFWSAIKGKSKPASMKNDVDALLAQKKIEADKTAETIGANLASFDQLAAGNDIRLFHDLDVLCLKDVDSFTAIVKTRIAEHKEAEANRIVQQKAIDQASSGSGPSESMKSISGSPATGSKPITSSQTSEPLELPFFTTSTEQLSTSLSLVSGAADLRAEVVADMATMSSDEIKQMAHMRDRIFAMRLQSVKAA